MQNTCDDLTWHEFAQQPEGVFGGSQAGSQEGDHVGVPDLMKKIGRVSVIANER